MSESEPNWKLLPDQPTAFFGLNSEFDKKDLKRAYNRFIKQYKPEKFPEEFKKIRAAYDEVERQLRYNHNNTPIVHPVENVTESEIEEKPEEVIFVDQQTGRIENNQQQEFDEDQFEKLKNEWLQMLNDQKPLPELEAWLLENELYLPDHFKDYLLTFISSIDNNSRSFIDLITSLPSKEKLNQNHINLIHEFCQMDLSTEEMIKLLEELSTRLDSNDYFYSTEPIWNSLTRKIDEEQFKSFYDECTLPYHLDSGVGQAIFLSKFLKSVALKYDIDWIEQKHSLVNDAIQADDIFYNDDLSTLDNLMYLRIEFSDDAKKTSGLKRVYDCIKEYYENDEIEGEKKVIEFILKLRNRENVRKWFPFREQVNYNLFYCFEAILLEIQQKREGFEEDDEVEVKQKWMETLFTKIEKISESQTLGTLRNLMYLLIIVIYLGGNGYLIYLYLTKLHTWFDWILKDGILDWSAAVILSILSLVVTFFIAGFFLYPVIDKINQFCTVRQYQPKWQDAIFDFFIQHPVKSTDFIISLEELADSTDSSYREEIQYLVNIDNAVMYYGLVQQFR